MGSARAGSGHRVVADVVEDEVVALRCPSEILPGVVDDVVGAERAGPSATFFVLDTPVTSAPRALAICTANVPTPPDAPLISTFCPGWTLPSSRRSCRAVEADTPTAAACSNVRLVGFGQKVILGPDRVLGERAGAPAEDLVAGSQPATSLPTASTVPATSVPGTRFFGFRSPVAKRMTNGEPVIRIQSPTWMDAARTRTSTSFGADLGPGDLLGARGRRPEP